MDFPLHNAAWIRKDAGLDKLDFERQLLLAQLRRYQSVGFIGSAEEAEAEVLRRAVGDATQSPEPLAEVYHRHAAAYLGSIAPLS